MSAKRPQPLPQPRSASRQHVAEWLRDHSRESWELSYAVMRRVDRYLDERPLVRAVMRSRPRSPFLESRHMWRKRVEADCIRQVRSERPASIGVVQWFFLALRVARMVRQLLDLYFECREFMDETRDQSPEHAHEESRSGPLDS